MRRKSQSQEEEEEIHEAVHGEVYRPFVVQVCQEVRVVQVHRDQEMEHAEGPWVYEESV
jgi:hypothetical protein